MAIKLTSEADQVCVAKAEEAGQSHLFDGWEDLSPELQRQLIAQVQDVDFQLLNRLVQQHLLGKGGEGSAELLQPAVAEAYPSPDSHREEYELCRTLGEYAIRQKQVMFVMASCWGGPAARPHPLGFLPVGPVTHKSLFQLVAEKIQALNRRFRISSRWTVVCHPTERERVTAYFRSQDYFGLQCSDLSVADQGVLPVVDKRGRILLSAPGQMLLCPNGHGGILHRLLDEGRLEALESAGVRHVFYFQGDNPLVNLTDPVFLGYHIKNEQEVTSKAVRRISPDERLGVFCRWKGKLGVVEHSELSQEDRTATAPDGSLLHWAGNAGVHVFSVEFLRRMRDSGAQLPFHAVIQATPHWSRRGRMTRPTQPNSYRFVAYAFDALRWAERTSVLEVRHTDELAPIRNPSGPTESPESVQQELSQQYALWLDQARPGWRDELDAASDPDRIEVSPLHALDARELKERLEGRRLADVEGLLFGRKR